MKISIDTLRWMNHEYGCTGEIMPNGIDELVEKIGAQLGAVEDVIDQSSKYQGIVIAKVLSSIKHPNADKLSLCMIDDGGVVKKVERNNDGLVQVVCGAPNVREGMLVVWLPPGVTVPSSYDKDPFVLEARELRGKISNGMLASAHELDISDDHSGIVEITDNFQPGQDFAKSYGLDGYVVDIENKMFTHRPDCFGFLGVARELAGIQNMKFKSPDWYQVSPKFPKIETDEIKVSLQNNLPKLVPRFTAVAMADVKVGPSPLWLQIELAKVGSRPINNIVDYTNFFMLETGQPLHAYDADKLGIVSGQKSKISLETRASKKGEKLVLLGGKEIVFEDESAILITSGDVPVGIGGVMGGADTEVDENTKNIVIECANFDMYSIRRTSMKYGLFTDAVTRFNKGQSPLQNLPVLAKIVDEIHNHAGGKVSSTVQDDNHLTKREQILRVSVDFVNKRLGLELSADEMQKIIENVEFEIERTDNKDELKITPPFWRTDIEIPEDIVEEVGRLYGFDRLPLVLPNRDLTPAHKDENQSFKQKIRETLSKYGANELLTYSFVHGNLIDQFNQDKKQAYKLKNAISPDLQYYRLSLIPSLLEKVRPNQKAGYDEFALYELNKTHIKKQLDSDNLPIENSSLALVYVASEKIKKSGSAYYQARLFLDQLVESLGIEVVYSTIKNMDEQAFKPFEASRSALVGIKGSKTKLGIIGEFKPTIIKNLKLPSKSAGFEISTDQLIKFAKSATRYTSIPKFPKVSQDISLKVSSNLEYAELYNFIENNLDVPDQTHFVLKPIDIYQGEDKNTKNITFRLEISSYAKTMTDSEVNKILENVSKKANTTLGAVRI